MYGDSKIDKIVNISFSIMMAGYGLVLGAVALGAASYAIDNYGIPVHEKEATITGVFKSNKCREVSRRVSVNVEGQIAEGCYTKDFTDTFKIGDTVRADTMKTRLTGVISYNTLKTK